jgi:hypothetical protein
VWHRMNSVWHLVFFLPGYALGQIACAHDTALVWVCLHADTHTLQRVEHGIQFGRDGQIAALVDVPQAIVSMLSGGERVLTMDAGIQGRGWLVSQCIQAAIFLGKSR